MRPYHTRGGIIQGVDTFPAGVHVTEHRLQEERTAYMEHAERNALYMAAREGISTANATATCSIFPCVDCARALIQAGITTLVTRLPHLSVGGVWCETRRHAHTMLLEAGVVIKYHS